MLLNALFDHVMDYPPVPERSKGTAETPGPSEVIDRRLPGGGGVYLLTDADGRVIQLASAGHLRRALRTRLRPPTAVEGDQAPAISRRRVRDSFGGVIRAPSASEGLSFPHQEPVACAGGL